MVARVLVIDDNPDLASNIGGHPPGARELEVEVRAVPEGRPGFRLAVSEGFDVAIVDVKLPDAERRRSHQAAARRVADGGSF